MAKQTIGIGSSANDGTGDPLRTAFDKCNDNFDELYEVDSQFTFDTVNDNYIYTQHGILDDATCNGVFILGGTTGLPHRVGNTANTPVTAPSTPPTSWGADSGYPGGAVVVNCIGGYDTIVNQTGGGTMMANHCHVKYNVNGHSYIVGGSGCVIVGSRSGIFASRESEIGGSSSTFNTILSADNSEIQSASYCLLTGLNNNIASGGHFSMILGRDCDVITNHEAAFIQGRYADSPAPYSHCIGNAVLENNDLRRWVQVDYKRTTNATTSNPTYLGSALPAGKTTSGLLRVIVTALQDGSADGDASGNYDVASWSGDVGFRWDGTNGYLYTASGTAGPSSDPSVALTTIRDNITCAAVPSVSINTGLLRVKVTGNASKTINFIISMEVVSTLVS